MDMIQTRSLTIHSVNLIWLKTLFLSSDAITIIKRVSEVAAAATDRPDGVFFDGYGGFYLKYMDNQRTDGSASFRKTNNEKPTKSPDYTFKE